MLRTRVIPCLLLENAQLVKTIKFKDPTYIGDPVNAIKIYNEKEVDELIFLDITATVRNSKLAYKIIRDIADECFMPLTYGGGIQTIEDIRKILSIGVEKVAINTYAIENPLFVKQATEAFGSQSIVVSIDAKRTRDGKYEVYTHGARKRTGKFATEVARLMEEQGAGELLLNSIDNDGTMEGYDLELIKEVSSSVNIPVIACGGAGTIEDFGLAVNKVGASAVAAGSLFVFHGRNRSVLISFPTQEELSRVLV